MNYTWKINKKKFYPLKLKWEFEKVGHFQYCNLFEFIGNYKFEKVGHFQYLNVIEFIEVGHFQYLK